MSLKRIVLDTNVLVAALRSRRGASFRLLSLIGTGRFELCLSVPLLFEYEDVLAREPIGIPAAAAADVLDYLCQVAIPQDIHFLWRPLLRDAKDDMVLELAVAADSSDIITFNIRDFTGSERFAVRAIAPAQFLTEIGELQ